MAIETLQDIFNYCNNDLLDGELDALTDIINYLNEAQNIIAEVALIEAPLVTTTLTSTCQVVIPANNLKVSEFALVRTDGVKEDPIEPIKEWNNIAYFNKSLEGRTINLYYYKKPTALNASTLTQVPDVDSRYFHSMAQYAAEMYKLKDDDAEAQESFTKKFIQGLTLYSKNKGAIRQFKNVW